VLYFRKGGDMTTEFESTQTNIHLKDEVSEENKISQSVIDNLKRPEFATITTDEITDYIFSFCKNLLSYAKDKYESKEIAYAINLNTLDFIGAAFGTSSIIDIEPLITKMEGTRCIFIVLHNHPSNGYFSPKDLNTFFETPNMAILVVLGNKGSIYTIEKKHSISFDEQFKIKRIIIDYRTGKINFMNAISKLAQFGIIYNQF
jgi:hypothetical protein